MFGIEPAVLQAYGLGGAVLLFFIVSGIKNWFALQREKAATTAEVSLLDNLTQENNRMAGMIEHMSIQMEKLMQDNSTLLSRINALEASVRVLSVWESKALVLQAELIEKDQTVNKLRATVAEQALLIERINTRGKNEVQTDR